MATRKRTNKDLQLLATIDSEVANGMGGRFSSGELARDRARNFDYYLGVPFGNEQAGRSQAILKDVAEVVDSLMPSLLRIFTTAENIVSFDPVGPEDIAAAQQETDVIQNVYWQQNDGFMLTYTWLKDGLLQKNGVIQALWDESEEVTRERYEGLSEQELTLLMDDPELEPIEQEEREDVVIKDVPPELQQLGAPPQAPTVATVFDVTFKRTAMKGRVVLQNIPPEEFVVSNDLTSLNLNEARFVGRVSEQTRQSLIDMGFDAKEVMALQSIDSSMLDTEEEISRHHLSDETDEGVNKDPLMDMVEVTEAYIRFDFDEDGIAELRQVIKAGNKVLSNVEVDRQPFHAWTPIPLPHKFFGLAVADNVHDIQLIRSTLLRQMLDNLYLANNPRKVVWEDAIGDTTMDEILTSRVGGTIRVTRPVNEAIRDENTPFVAGQAFPMLEFFEERRKNRTGVGSDVEGLDANTLKNVQTTVVAQMSDMSRMQIEAYARVFAETGLKSLFNHIRELLRKNSTKTETFRLRGEFIEVDPTNWRERKDMTILVGLGTGTREQKLIHLQAIKELQSEIIAGGGLGTLVTPQNIYNTSREFVRNALFPDPDMFFQNPANLPPEAFENKDDANELQKQFLQMQAQIEQGKLQIEGAKNQLATEKAALDHQRKVVELERKQQELLIDRSKAAIEAGEMLENVQVKRTELEQEQQRINQGERRIDLEAEKALNDLMLRTEQLAAKLTEMELKFDSDIPGSKV